jgi:N-acetylglucosamine-6-sulfatase
LDPYTYEYYNAAVSSNGGEPVSYRGQYSPDVIAEKAYGLLREAASHDQPFFLVAAPIAPHGEFPFEPFNPQAPKYAARHAHLFKDYQIPRTDNFNPEKQGGASWIKHLPRLNDTVIAYNDEYQRCRLRALQSVDEMVEGLVQILEEKDLMDDTYFIYSTDNGYHISQHRMHPGKECGYDTDIHIPLVIRGPGLAAGKTVNIVTSHTDLSPTIMEIAGGRYEDYGFDGLPIPLDTESELPARSEHVNVEFWGWGLAEGKWGYHGDVHNYSGPGTYPNNTYKSVRLISEEYSLYYSVWCTNEKELYDLKVSICR